MSKATIFILSGSLGTSGSQVVRTALAQILTNDIPFNVVQHVHRVEPVEQVVTEAATTDNAIIVHTLSTQRDLFIFTEAHVSPPTRPFIPFIRIET